MAKYSWITLADLHLKLNEPLGKIQGNLNTRTRDKLAILQRVCNIAVEKKVDFVFFSGDMFDRLNPPERLRKYFIKAIMSLIKNKIPIYWIIGNHETDMHSSNFMAIKDLIDPLHIINEIDSFNLEGWHFVMVPSLYYDNEIVQILDKLNKERTLLFGHWETKEALVGEEEFRYHDGISANNYKGFKRVYLGDFHKYQRYDNWMYVGSLCKKTFSERSDAKGFIYTLFDSETGDITDNFIQVPDRKFIQIEDVDNINLNTKDAVVKLVFKTKESWIDKNTIVKELYNSGAHKVIYEFKNILDTSEQDNEISSLTTFEEDIATYCKEKKALTELGIQVLNTVRG